MIQATNLTKRFDENDVLKEINLQIRKGEFAAVMGQSGCGKSTLLYCLSGMDRPTEGEVRFKNRNLGELSEKETENLRLHHMGFIFQKPNFLKNLSIADNIIFPAFRRGGGSRREIIGEAEELMKAMNITSVADKDCREVSGGQLQRAAICRAMINRPEILFGDEPTGALNSSATVEVMDLFGRIHRGGTTVLLVTHDAKVAVRADRVIYLEDGRIKEELSLGGYKPEEELSREKRLTDWLNRMGF